MSPEILVPVDGSPIADKAVAHAAEIARKSGGSVHLVRVHRPLSWQVVPSDSAISLPDAAMDERLRAEAAAWLARRERDVRALNDVPVTSEMSAGDPASEIVLVASRRGSRLVVCTTRGAGGSAWSRLGSVADGIIRNVLCPVLAMSQRSVEREVHVATVLVLLDGSEASGAIIPHAGWLAHVFGAELDYLRLAHPPEDPASSIRAYIERTKPDVVALATHGRGVSRLILGGVADELLRTADRPILAFRPRDMTWTKPGDG